MLIRRRLATLLLLPFLAPLAACGGDGGDDPGTTEDPGAVFNDADVAFATEMIPHHAQALAMVDLTTGREVHPGLTRLAEEIRATQAPEIELMADWLTEWGEPVPETIRDHANAHGDAHLEDSHSPGMLSAEELDELGDLSGPAFEQEWVAAMIGHHEGAVEMAEAEIEAGRYPAAVDLARQIAEGQAAEITELERLRSRLGS